jgi:hypothetical protein
MIPRLIPVFCRDSQQVAGIYVCLSVLVSLLVLVVR